MSIGISVEGTDRAGLLRDVAICVADRGANIEAIHLTGKGEIELHMDVSDIEDIDGLTGELREVEGVSAIRINQSSGSVFGKRVIVIGGGAQIAQVVLGAVSEADRHNLRGEKISVDTIPLIGEQSLAEAVRAVGRLPRAHILVLAGSLMGGDVSQAVRELRLSCGIPVISLNMVGSVTDAVDLVVSDAVQAGVMAVMAIADTAAFDIGRMRGRRL